MCSDLLVGSELVWLGLRGTWLTGLHKYQLQIKYNELYSGHNRINQSSCATMRTFLITTACSESQSLLMHAQRLTCFTCCKLETCSLLQAYQGHVRSKKPCDGRASYALLRSAGALRGVKSCGLKRTLCFGLDANEARLPRLNWSAQILRSPEMCEAITDHLYLWAHAATRCTKI